MDAILTIDALIIDVALPVIFLITSDGHWSLVNLSL